MKISTSWLQKYLSRAVSAQELNEIFTDIGHEVEEVISIGVQRQDTLVVGEIQTIDKHPNADKLSVCKVCVGDDVVVQIVCGAKNFKLGDHVPVALAGTRLPGNILIERGNLRGVTSEGMMCSGRELGLGNDHSGLLILDRLAQVGKCLHDVIAIENDTIFDLSLTANRGDCLSYIGIARDVAAKLNIDLIIPEVPEVIIEQSRPCGHFLQNVTITADACMSYFVACMDNIVIKDSPQWMQSDLEHAGIRSINNVVDVGNWVMLETGQPVHVFDAKKIHDGKLYIRKAFNDESFVALDGKTYALQPPMTVIGDDVRPLAVAGVTGSEYAGVDNNTTSVVIEVANFDPDNVRKCARDLNISTDSSYRFSRGIDHKNIPFALARIISLLQQNSNGEFASNCWAAKPSNIELLQIKFNPACIGQTCGFDIPLSFCKNALSKLGFLIHDDGAVWNITVPAHRSDIVCPADIVSECLRIYGTSHIVSEDVVSKGTHRKDDGSFCYRQKCTQYFADNGFLECYNLSLQNSKIWNEIKQDGDILKIPNPLTSTQDCFRPSLILGLLDVVKTNLQNGNVDRKFFEIGDVVVNIGGKLTECISIACVAIADEIDRSWRGIGTIDFYDMKSLIFPILQNFSQRVPVFNPIEQDGMWQSGHSGTCGLLHREKFYATCGLLNVSWTRKLDIKPSIVAAEVIVHPDIFKRKISKIKYNPFTSYPHIAKDMSIIVPCNVSYDVVENDVKRALKKSTPKDIEISSIKCFDVYQGHGIPDNTKNIGITIDYRSNTRTLTDKEIQECFNAAQDILAEKYDLRRIS